MNTIGLDIGGANLKAVLLRDDQRERIRAIEVPFAMWTRWRELQSTLSEIVDQIDPEQSCRRIAVTMTGELADCFTSKKEGVAYIADAVGKMARGNPVFIYQVDGNWSRCEAAEENWQLIAASNWHAMARIGAKFLPQQTGLIIDVGSTTTDVTLVANGQPQAVGANDFTRLENLELIYAGAGRTPVCSLIQSVNVDDQNIPLAREFFATISDALIHAGLMPEDLEVENTADGRSNSKTNAAHRLARMVCSDAAEISSAVIDSIASQTIKIYRALLINAIKRAIQGAIDESEASIESVLLVGSGSFLAEQILAEEFPQLTQIALSQRINSAVNTCGPAYAVAALLRE